MIETGFASIFDVRRKTFMRFNSSGISLRVPKKRTDDSIFKSLARCSSEARSGPSADDQKTVSGRFWRIFDAVSKKRR